ncbi:WxL domain-containing protein [Enterococcus sp. 1001283B150225_161107_E12]|uniref:WxL domain-containing protein n=1 Tax=Enterococcus sp. 1001283B150225_161107_E12 TaxID=2787145 RepID=UPI00189D813C|nr:WxL domain-containing protein [Enterococcus sp. 1001283B150225_161107_E12]
MKFKHSLFKMVSLSCLLVLGSNYACASELEHGNPAEVKTPLSGNLGLSENGGYDPNPPSDLNKKTEINNSYLGISYIPKTFDFGTTKLTDNVQEQTVETKNGEKTYNVGVKDKRREDTQQWSLNVKHNLSIDNGYRGVTLTVPINGEVKRNINDGKSPFQENELTDQVKKYDQDEVQKAEVDKINVTSTDNTIMHTTGGQFVNGVYDLELGNVTLNIPDASKVPAQTINGTVEWTLSNTPMKQSYLTQDIRNLFKDGNCKELKNTITSENVKAAKQSIQTIKDEKQKAYNESYFKDYVEEQFVEWYGRGIYYKGSGDISVARVNFYKNSTNNKVELYMHNLEWYTPHSYWDGKDYMVVTVKRGTQILLDEHIKGDDHLIETKSVELQPGDIIEIFHAEGKGSRLSVYPTEYKNGGVENQKGFTIKYKVDDNLDLQTLSQ